MMSRNAQRRNACNRGIGTLVILIVLSLALAGCDTALAALTDSARPTDVSATDGEYETQVEITWTAPDLSSEEDEKEGSSDRQLLRYELERQTMTGPLIGQTHLVYDIDAGTTEYVDQGLQLNQGILYEYRVRAVFSDETQGVSRPDTGYAITAGDIQLGSSLGRSEYVYNTAAAHATADSKVWFTFLAQQGWRYQVQAETSPAETTGVRLLSEKELEPAPENISEAGSIFTAERSGLHYVELHGGSGTVSVRYLGAE
ncbi:MAG: fibronectin type III domain-containing protein [Alkalispirochaeta sp.]